MCETRVHINSSLWLKRLFLSLILCSLITFTIFPQAKQETVNGYCDYHFLPSHLIIVDGQRIITNKSTKFKNGSVTLPGAEAKVKGTRQPDGSILASEIDNKSGGTALFAVEALNGASQMERFWLSRGSVLEPSSDGWMSMGNIISEGPQVTRVQNIMSRLLPPYFQLYQDILARVHVYVIENEDWNASSMANGSVWVNSGLLRDMSDDELAIILGHELVHYTYEHTRRMMKKDMLIGLTAAAAESFTHDVQTQQLIGLAFSAWRNGYSRGYEDQADRVGLRYAYEAGFDVSKSIRLWERFEQKYPQSDKLTNLIFGDHSRNTDRIRNLQNEINLNYLQKRPDGPR